MRVSVSVRIVNCERNITDTILAHLPAKQRNIPAKARKITALLYNSFLPPETRQSCHSQATNKSHSPTGMAERPLKEVFKSPAV